MLNFKNSGGTTDPEEYKKRFYRKGSDHWERSGKYAYSTLKKFKEKSEAEDLSEEEEVIKGLCSKDVKCSLCKTLIRKHKPIVKVGNKIYHPSCWGGE